MAPAKTACYSIVVQQGLESNLILLSPRLSFASYAHRVKGRIRVEQVANELINDAHTRNAVFVCCCR